jgi:FKBP-type peptidyl-prolyl cis-trans isomerase SlyD
MTTVAKNSVVSMRYIMKNSNGEILENTMHSLPISYLHGTESILSLLQEQLEGLKAGDKKIVYLNSVSGLTAEDFVFEVIIDQVRVALEEEILLGYPVEVNVQACEADCDCYNATLWNTDDTN